MGTGEDDRLARLRLEGLRFQGRGPVDLCLEAGECAVLGGPSGVGKTLLLRAIADLDDHEGEAWLDGVACRALPAPEWRRRVGMLPSESRWWRETVGEHLPPLAAGWLAALDLPEAVRDWRVDRLSSGERQRLALLRLLGHEPEALLLDEPTANLDATNVARAEALLADYRSRRRAAVLWVTHDRFQAARVATRWLALEGGRLVEREETRACP
jgi:UDP-glucose/iron transport system ATP-binding protein